MVTTHKSQYPLNASTPGITRLWSAGVLTTVSLYSQHNLPSPPQRKGAAGGKLLIKTTHLSNSPLSIGRIVESFHDGYTIGETVIGPFGWREYVLHDMEHTSTVGKVSERECRDLPRYLSLATGGVEAWVGVRAAGGGDGVLMVSGAEKGVGVLAAQIARAMGWKVWGVAKGVEGVAVAKDTGGCERVWQLQDLEWRREMEMVNVVLACSGDKEVLRVMKRGAVVVACGDSDVESETKGLLVSFLFG